MRGILWNYAEIKGSQLLAKIFIDKLFSFCFFFIVCERPILLDFFQSFNRSKKEFVCSINQCSFSIFFVLFLTERLLIKISKIAGLVKSFVQLYFSSGKKRKILFENFVWKNRLNEFVRFFKFVQTNGNIIHEQSTSLERFYIIFFLFFSFAFENNSFFISLKIQVVRPSFVWETTSFMKNFVLSKKNKDLLFDTNKSNIFYRCESGIVTWS